MNFKSVKSCGRKEGQIQLAILSAGWYNMDEKRVSEREFLFA